MLFTNKHIFIISDRDIFFHLYADALVNKCNVNPNQIIAVIYKLGGISTLVKHQSYQYIEYKKELCEELSLASTITTISLNSKNATVIRDLCEERKNLWKKIHVFITDDEVDLWRNNLDIDGGLFINEKKGITKNLLFVLNKMHNFIVTEKYFREILETILRRHDFCIVNASFIFDILPFEQSELIKNILGNLNYQKSNRILLGSKGFTIKGVFKFIWTNYSTLKNMQVVFFPTSLARRIIIDIYLLFLRTIYRAPIEFNYLGKINSITYNAMIASCSYFVLQDRGGASSARLYAKWGCGMLLISKGTPNERYFREVYDIDILDWKTDRFNCLNIDKEAKIIRQNSEKISNEEIRSIEILRELYLN